MCQTVGKAQVRMQTISHHKACIAGVWGDVHNLQRPAYSAAREDVLLQNYVIAPTFGLAGSEDHFEDPMQISDIFCDGARQ
jgi:hypothetical protein